MFGFLLARNRKLWLYSNKYLDTMRLTYHATDELGAEIVWLLKLQQQAWGSIHLKSSTNTLSKQPPKKPRDPHLINGWDIMVSWGNQITEKTKDEQ